MDRSLVYLTIAALTLQIIDAKRAQCPSDPNCICGGTLAVELNCNIDGHTVKINLLPNIYIDIKCENTTSLNYDKLPKCANDENTFKSVSFKDCPLPSSSFKDVLTNMGVSKTMGLIFQNAKNLSGYFDRKHFTGLEDLTKLLLSIKGVTHLPNNLFVDINKLTWLNIRSNSINLSEELFKPLERLETLEISHNHMTNISSNLFSHLSFLRKLSLWQSNVTWFSKDLFSGVDVLEELDLSSNGLNELPASIFKPLKRLKKLTLFSNKFSSLPHNLFKNNKELETVVILNNDDKLKGLPKYLFGNLTYLTQIYIQRSGLEIVPQDVFADSQQITNISLAHNDIKTLPESVFNDQVNLLELDLSYNRLTELKIRLFSSLLRLERLNLCHNSLVEIAGPVFTPLYSLTYLNMEHNKLRKISTYLFGNTGQSMTVSFAYNKLNFEEIVVVNNTERKRRSSPFRYTYKLKLLNLSHNEFEVGFPDWWMNGHENLDISYNNIQELWDERHLRGNYRNLIKLPPKRVWLSNNNLHCECRNFYFIHFLIENIFSFCEVVDMDQYCCPNWTVLACSGNYLLYIGMFTILGTAYVLVIIFLFIYKQEIEDIIMKRFGHILGYKNTKNSVQNLIIKYSEYDEDFVLRELLPTMKTFKNIMVHMHPIKRLNNTVKCMNKINVCVNDMNKYKVIVIFSPNYLTTNYSHVDIKKIHTEMIKAEKTVYVFVDIGPENSIYAFLNGQRDEMKTVEWCEPNFWDRLFGLIIEIRKKSDEEYDDKINEIPYADKEYPSDISFSKLPDWPVCYDINSPIRTNQV